MGIFERLNLPDDVLETAWRFAAVIQRETPRIDTEGVDAQLLVEALLDHDPMSQQNHASDHGFQALLAVVIAQLEVAVEQGSGRDYDEHAQDAFRYLAGAALTPKLEVVPPKVGILRTW